MRHNVFSRIFLVAAVLMSPAVAQAADQTLSGLIRNIVQVGVTTIEQTAARLQLLPANAGGRLVTDAADVLVEAHGQCRWLDNTGTVNDIFVPLSTPLEWQAFIDNAPNYIRRATCCPATTVRLTAADGQYLTINLPVGREGSSGNNGQRSFSRAFDLIRSDGGVLRETVSDTFYCTAGAWTSDGATSNTVVISEPEVDTPDDPGDPLPVCGTPAAVENVVATWTGQMRRAWGGNATYSQTGFTGNTGSYYANGNSDTTTVAFTLAKPAKDTPVKVTAVYTNYTTFSNGTPKVANFTIADGQTINSGNAPSTGIFYTSNRKGWPFQMTNSTVNMPLYDSSPNITSLQVEYTVQKPCVDPVDAIVMASTCQADTAAGARHACISNGSACLSALGTGIYTFNPASHVGTFCSAVSNTDSGPDGARATFDLRPQLNGRTGSAQIIVPFGAWTGIRELGQARAVMANPNAYVSIPNRPTVMPKETALVFNIYDVNASAQMSMPVTTLDSGCGKDCRNNIAYNLQYNGATKSLSVWIQKGSRWKKNDGLYEQPAATWRSWNQQYLTGYGNGKVWSEVRVIAPVDLPPPPVDDGGGYGGGGGGGGGIGGGYEQMNAF